MNARVGRWWGSPVLLRIIPKSDVVVVAEWMYGAVMCYGKKMNWWRNQMGWGRLAADAMPMVKMRDDEDDWTKRVDWLKLQQQHEVCESIVSFFSEWRHQPAAASWSIIRGRRTWIEEEGNHRRSEERDVGSLTDDHHAAHFSTS